MDKKIFEISQIKSTKKRQLIISTLESAKDPITAEDILDRLSAENKINLSTIYRTLNILSKKGIIIKITRQDKKYYYQMNTKRHNHLIICNNCYKIIPIDTCPLEEFVINLSNKTGYVITGHSLEFTGICPACIDKLNKKI